MENPFLPPHIRTIAIVAPAGPPPGDKLAAGIAVLEQLGIRTATTPDLFTRDSGTSYLSASLETRLANFNAAIRNPDVDLILCARGGFGSVHLLAGLDWTTLVKRNLPVLGYSDITAIHAGMLARRAGMPIAGTSAVKLPEALTDKFSSAALAAALNPQGSVHGLPEPPAAVQPVTPESAAMCIEAPPFAANLTVLTTLCGTEFLPDLTGRILILEDVNEPLYKLDRYLTQLAMNHVFDKLAGLCFGSFSGVPPTAELFKLEERIARLVPGPTYRNFAFGHAFPMTAANAGQRWRLDAGRVAAISPFLN